MCEPEPRLELTYCKHESQRKNGVSMQDKFHIKTPLAGR
jgi:hypothetical protein